MSELFDSHTYDRVEVVRNALPGQEFMVTKNEKQPQTFQRIILAPPNGKDGNFFLEVGPTNFEKFLEFVSKNFRINYATQGAATQVICKQHDAVIKNWHGHLNPGELEMMAAIGKHLDEVEHSFPQVPHTWQTEN